MIVTYIEKTLYIKKMHKKLQDVFEGEHENNRILALCWSNAPNEEKNGIVCWKSEKKHTDIFDANILVNDPYVVTVISMFLANLREI